MCATSLLSSPDLARSIAPQALASFGSSMRCMHGRRDAELSTFCATLRVTHTFDAEQDHVALVQAAVCQAAAALG